MQPVVILQKAICERRAFSHFLVIHGLATINLRGRSLDVYIPNS